MAVMKTSQASIFRISKPALSVLFLGLVVSLSSCGHHGACPAYTSEAVEINELKEARAIFAKVDQQLQALTQDESL
jgi:hypothetical protein